MTSTSLERSGEAAGRPPHIGPLVKAAAATSAFTGLGFGLPCIYGIRVFAQTKEVATFLGFPTYGDGPFAAVGIATSVPLLSAFLGVCAAEVVTARLLLKGRPSGEVLAFGLLPVEMIFWTGFALPFGPLLGATRTGLLLAARKRSRFPAAPTRKRGES